jgi:uncharacterized repeat protein (TIGR01451 family)
MTMKNNKWEMVAMWSCSKGNLCIRKDFFNHECIECISIEKNLSTALLSDITSQTCADKKIPIDPPKDPNAKSVDIPGDILPGETLTYTIDYENEGQGTAYEVFILDELDPSLDETTLTINDDGANSEASRILSWDIGEIPPGGLERIPGQAGQDTGFFSARE